MDSDTASKLNSPHVILDHDAEVKPSSLHAVCGPPAARQIRAGDLVDKENSGGHEQNYGDGKQPGGDVSNAIEIPSDSEDDKMKTPSDLEDDNGTKETATLQETDAMLARVVFSPNQPEGACKKCRPKLDDSDSSGSKSLSPRTKPESHDRSLVRAKLLNRMTAAAAAPSTVAVVASNDLNTSTKWDGSNETHDGYKAWVNDVSLWANNNQMAWIMKITKRLQEAPNFRRPVSRAPREQFFDEAKAAREELIPEIQRSAETDAGEDPAEDEQADDVTFGHKMMYLAEPYWNVTSNDFADEDLTCMLRGDGKKKIDFVASMHMLKLQCLTVKLGETAWNDLSSMHVPDKAALCVLHSQIMAQELHTLNSKFVSSLWNF